MAETTHFPRYLILGAALVGGMLLAIAVHMIAASYGLDLGGLWRPDGPEIVPTKAAIAWWLVAGAGGGGGYLTASLMESAVSGEIPPRLRQLLIAVGVLLLAGAGHVASAPSKVPVGQGLLAGLAALVLGAVMAFCGAHFSMRTS